MSTELTKLRLIHDRLQREHEAAEAAALEARQAWERAQIAYLNQAEREGLCRSCLKPRAEGSHDGYDHIVLADSAGEPHP